MLLRLKIATQFADSFYKEIQVEDSISIEELVIFIFSICNFRDIRHSIVSSSLNDPIDIYTGDELTPEQIENNLSLSSVTLSETLNKIGDRLDLEYDTTLHRLLTITVLERGYETNRYETPKVEDGIETYSYGSPPFEREGVPTTAEQIDKELFSARQELEEYNSEQFINSLTAIN